MAKSSKSIAIVGGGPAGLMAAEQAALAGCAVTVFDAMPSLGRKFLLAGRGGLNLTHSEKAEGFLARYGDAAGPLEPVISLFPPDALRQWALELGEKTFVGTSGRVFPESLKASPLLRAWLRRLGAAGVATRLRHRFVGFGDGGGLRFETPEGAVDVHADAVVLALGGASWPRLGSDGGWVAALADKSVAVAPLIPANCGFDIAWSDMFREKFAGAPLKSIALRFAGRVVRGEAVVTARGIEGGAVYALSASLRDAIAANGAATLIVDTRPDTSVADLARRLSAPRGKQSTSNFLRKAAGLPPVAIALLREAGPLPAGAEELAAQIKSLPMELVATRPIERAISTAGGVAWDEIDGTLALKKLPGVFVAGEMLDWEAPTGGYLMQACFATGFLAGRGAAEWARRPKKRVAKPRRAKSAPD